MPFFCSKLVIRSAGTDFCKTFLWDKGHHYHSIFRGEIVDFDANGRNLGVNGKNAGINCRPGPSGSPKMPHSRPTQGGPEIHLQWFGMDFEMRELSIMRRPW